MVFSFRLHKLYIRFYGIILMLGALAAAFLAEHEAKRKGLKSEFVWDALIWVLIAGIIGARLWHVFTPPPSMVALGYTTKYYLTHPSGADQYPGRWFGYPGSSHRWRHRLIFIFPLQEAELPGVGGYCRPRGGTGTGDRALG